MWTVRREMPVTLAVFAEHLWSSLHVYGLVFVDCCDIFLQKITIEYVVPRSFADFAHVLITRTSVRDGAT
jgi:hypothetical protein